MNSIIIKLASKYLRALLIIFSVFVLLRGHNYPGGGFIGGILAASGIFFDAFANTVGKVQQKLLIKPVQFISIGLACCLSAAILGIFIKDAVLASIWIKEIKVGTPLLFDVGVYFVVTGVFLLALFSIMEELQWK